MAPFFNGTTFDNIELKFDICVLQHHVGHVFVNKEDMIYSHSQHIRLLASYLHAKTFT
jgi:hypothetical protein